MKFTSRFIRLFFKRNQEQSSLIPITQKWMKSSKLEKKLTYSKIQPSMKRFATASKTGRPIFQFCENLCPKFSSFYTSFFFHWYFETAVVVCFCLTLSCISWIRVEKKSWALSSSNWVLPAELSQIRLISNQLISLLLQRPVSDWGVSRIC